VYELLSKKDELSDEMSEILEYYTKGIEFYSQRDWDEAIKCFEKALKINKKDGPSRVYLQRSKKYKENPPDEGWNAITILDTK
jgi:adenylate cyclase